jgi:hypothetical protein
MRHGESCLCIWLCVSFRLHAYNFISLAWDLRARQAVSFSIGSHAWGSSIVNEVLDSGGGILVWRLYHSLLFVLCPLYTYIPFYLGGPEPRKVWSRSGSPVLILFERWCSALRWKGRRRDCVLMYRTTDVDCEMKSDVGVEDDLCFS